jgi:hypothetical protein
MTIVITDPVLLSQLTQASKPVEIHDAKGNFVGTFAPPYGKLPPGMKSPITDEEIEELRKQPDGRPLADILRDLEKRG